MHKSIRIYRRFSHMSKIIIEASLSLENSFWHYAHHAVINKLIDADVPLTSSLAKLLLLKNIHFMLIPFYKYSIENI